MASPSFPVSSKPLLKVHILVDSQEHDLAVFLDSWADAKFMDPVLAQQLGKQTEPLLVSLQV